MEYFFQVFDPNVPVDESNKDYRKVHEEYKSLVDFMLGSFMEEMEITPEQFEYACLEGRNQQGSPQVNFHQGLFQQIWAANDIKIFIRMMIQRNIELQIQALDLIDRGSSVDFEEKINEETDSDINEPKESGASGGPVSEEVDSIQFERLNLFFGNKDVDKDELESRQEYLRSQRDKIVKIKKLARVRQFSANNLGNVTSKGRPSSAQVAQKYLQGDTRDVLGNSEEMASASMKLRKTLAERLRNEVVENN